MAGGLEGERPRQDFSSGNRLGPVAPNPEGAGNAQLAPPGQEQRGWHDRPHAELVSAFRGLIQKEHQELGDRAKYFSSATILNNAFSQQVQYIFSDDKGEKQRGAYFAQILHAWQVIAYEHYGEGSVNSGDLDRHYAGLDLDTQYNRAKLRNSPHPETITLTDSLQVRIIDAAAEAAGIPHQRGQTAFEIPEKLRDYEAQVHQANEERRRRGG
jgi:hypothetical protein